VLELIVAVSAPAGRLRNAQMPPMLSASAITAPPCSIPPVVHSSADQARLPRTSAGSALASSIPSRLADGIMSTGAARSVPSPPDSLTCSG
jgi:hypothetical protein